MMDTILGCGLFNLAVLVLAAGYSIIFLRIPIYHPYFIYLIYHFLGFVVRPLSIYQQDSSFLWQRIGFIPFPEDIFRTTLVSSLALLAVTAGLIYGCRNRAVPRMPPVVLKITRQTGFYLALAVATVLGYYATYRSLSGAGLDTVLAYQTAVTNDGTGQELVGISGYLTAMAETLPILCVMLFLIPRLRPLAIPFILCFIGFRLFAGAQRLSFVVVVAAIFLIIHINKGYRYPRILPLAGIVCFALLFDIIGSDRYAVRKLYYGSTSAQTVVSSYFDSRGGQAMTSDVVEFDVATAVMSVVHTHSDYSYGSQYLRLLIWPIPRQLWPNKPVNTSSVNLNKYGDFRYLTQSLYADVYMNIGFTLVPILMFLLGRFYAWSYAIAMRTGSTALYMFFWVNLMYTKTVLRDGGVSFVYFWVFSMATVLLVVWAGQIKLVRRMDPRMFRRVVPVERRPGAGPIGDMKNAT